jgi:hypothetical protein
MTTLALTNQSIAPASTATAVSQIQTALAAMLKLQSTGGTLTADGNEQNLYIENEPLGAFEPTTLYLDLDAMALGDTTVVRVYYRLSDGGGLQQIDYQSYAGADGGLLNGNKLIKLDLGPNRHGLKVTLQQTAGVNRDYPFEIFTRAQ